MDQSQLYSLAKSAGLSDGNAKTAAAIAMAESGGNPNSHNSTPPDDSYGLWQINMLGSLGPSRRAVYRLKANSDLFDPATNARVMAALSQGGRNFKPWTTYTSGAYRQFINNPVTAVAGPKAGGAYTDRSVPNLLDATGLSDVKSIIDLATRTSDAITKTGRWVSNPQNWVRVAYVLIGGTAILLGVTAIAKATPAGKAATKAAGKAVDTGVKAAKTAAVA